MMKDFLKRHLISYFLLLFGLLTSAFFYTDCATTAFHSAMENGGKILDKKYGTYLFGVGGEMKEDRIEKFGMDFQIQKKMTKNEIRNLLINMSEDFYRYVVSYKKVHPYLDLQSFSKEKICLTLYFTDKGRTLFYPDISVGSIGDTILGFDYNDPEKPIGPYKFREKESYEEALKALQVNEYKEPL